jgi:oxygen-independent coproporphyrinogen III oxidase
MAGIYLHIPFCKQACNYCNFHFSTSLRSKNALINGILKEIELQKDYLQEAELSSIYFGGGTPSLLDVQELQAIFGQINRFFKVSTDAEITLEANPDDLTISKLSDFKEKTPINRLSIGIQSFSNEDLLWMNRAHNAEEANQCVENAQKVGFENLTVDLIYGTPTTSDAQWEDNIQRVLAYNIPHISCYCLTVEDKTSLAKQVKNGLKSPIDEEKAARQFDYLVKTLGENGFEHYEISNFAKPDRYARHNTNYWKSVPYLGIGPSAHSFNGHTRQWNIANNAQYIKALEADFLPFEIENLTDRDRYNEYVMTSMRTIWGCDLGKIAAFGQKFEDYFLLEIKKHLAKGTVQKKEANYVLTSKGKFFADGISSELFFPME